MNTIALKYNPADEFRRWLYIGICGSALIASLASCSKDTPELPELKSTVYTSSTLDLSYNGELMPGKSVRVEIAPSSDGSQTSANLHLYSEFDLSQLSGMGLSGSIPAPGVIPGSPEVDIPVTLYPSDGSYTFSGSGSTDYADFNYSGKIEKDKLTLNITDSKLKSQIFAGQVLAPSPIVKDGLFEYSSIPFHIVWELDPSADIQIPLSDILKAILTAPVIPVYNNSAYTSVAQVYYSTVKTVAMTSGGNIPVVYVSTVGGAAHFATSCGNMLQYVPAEGGIRLYVNPLSALSQVLVALSKPQEDAEFVTKADSGSDTSILDKVDPALLNAIVKSLITAIQPSIRDGVPLTVAPGNNGTDIYLDTKTSVVFLSTLAKDLLTNPEIAAKIKAYLAELQIPDLTPEQIDGIFAQLPGFLEKTTKLEVGLSFVKAPEK